MQRYLGCRARLRVVTHCCSHWIVCIIFSFVSIPSRVVTALSLEYRRCGELSFNPFQSSYCFVSLARCRHDSCDARMSQEKNLHNDSSSLIGHFAADTFDFFLAVLTQEVEAYACALRVFVPRIPNAIPPVLAPVLVPSPWRTLGSGGGSAARCCTQATNACQSAPISSQRWLRTRCLDRYSLRAALHHNDITNASRQERSHARYARRQQL
jgi:hypothetical protein